MKKSVDIEELKTEHAQIKAMYLETQAEWKAFPVNAQGFDEVAARYTQAKQRYKNIERKRNWHLAKKLNGGWLPSKESTINLQLDKPQIKKVPVKTRCYRCMNAPEPCKHYGEECKK